ncbi:MAG: DUF6912 family protein [Actinomycetales bacterium]
MRIYLPLTLPALRAAVAAGEIGPAPLPAHAVTPALREWYASGDEEELEYVATMAAAQDSLRLLPGVDGGQDSERRRVVVAADVADSSVRPTLGGGSAPGARAGERQSDRSGVRVAVPVPLSQVVSAHVDDPAAAEAVRAALAALPAADAGDEDAQWVVEALDDHELQWFAAQEFGGL